MRRGGPIVVVGAGIAGTASAIAAARTGARVVLVDGGTGATALWTGGIDATWGAAPTPAPALSDGARGVLDALGVCRVSDGAAVRLATTAGVVRSARGHDRGLLDVAPHAGRLVGVVACPRPGWDASALARAWGPGFALLAATVLRHVDERVLPSPDFAARHDEDDRLGWLADRLRDAVAAAGTSFAALLLPPSLGIERARAEALATRVGIPCGEAIGLPGGPAGLRFERARDRALAAARVDVVRARASSVIPQEDHWRVVCQDAQPIDAAAVVLAAGGLVGGGIAYAPAEAELAGELPARSRPPFRLGLEAPAVIGANGRPLEAPGSLFGVPPERLAWPFASDGPMDRAGILAGEAGHVYEGLYAAGEIVADAPRTWIAALESGTQAGLAAAACATEPRRRSSPSEAPASQL